jgi:predicted O-methyltransferase YrrM
MYSPLKLAAKYFRYYLGASSKKGHGTHSPFVFGFIKNVLNTTTSSAITKPIENLRRELLNDRRSIDIQDYGAGSVGGSKRTRSISSIIKTSAKPPRYAQLLSRIVSYYKPINILELGTSMGITTSYLALGNPQGRVITIEGSSVIASKAVANFQQLEITNVRVVPGKFEEVLDEVLKEMPFPDLVFIDGNHRYQPTINYFNKLLGHVRNDSILIFDDIHWSREMEEAWKTISSNPEVTCTIDLFFIGIVLFRQEFREKQHFCIRY